MRTFVVSDAHGYPELIHNALDHGDFQPGEDGFVYAGDLLDRGPDPEGCIDLVDRYATEVLLGNHEVGVMLDFAVYPQTPGSSACRQVLFDRVLSADPGRAWKAATCIEGVLVTHAGVSSRYERVFREQCQGDSSLLAALLNTTLLAAIRHELETGEWEEDGILGDHGPTWFRPRHSGLLPLSGLRQVVGHTWPMPELEEAGFYMVDPCAWLGMDDPERFRYAVIEDGKVRVQEGTLTPLPAADHARELEGAPCC
ncbi:MAG: metallophosphoesterase [Actinomycetia bacterium]|nr:metallophosphoesterase [Actinomycetes bacterium]